MLLKRTLRQPRREIQERRGQRRRRGRARGRSGSRLRTRGFSALAHDRVRGRATLLEAQPVGRVVLRRQLVFAERGLELILCSYCFARSMCAARRRRAWRAAARSCTSRSRALPVRPCGKTPRPYRGRQLRIATLSAVERLSGRAARRSAPAQQHRTRAGHLLSSADDRAQSAMTRLVSADAISKSPPFSS